MPIAATTCDKYRREILARGIAPVIARRGIARGSGLSKKWWFLERGFTWLHQHKRLRTRYEVRTDLHLGSMKRPCALICYRGLPTAASCNEYLVPRGGRA